VTFHSPVWLYAIPAALLVLWFLFHLAARARKRELGKFAADRLLAGLLRSFSPARRRFKHLLIAAGVALVMLALARPEYGYTWRESPARGIDVLFVLDSSKSMLAQDIRPNRLERSKLAILDFVDKIPGDRVGLVAFAGNAFLQCPLTLDYDAFRLALEAVDTNVIAHGGTDIARALTEAENAFSADNNHKIVVLITDGEDLEQSGVDQARLLASRGMTVYTVGVGTPEGELIPVETERGQIEYLRDSDGKPVTTRLDEQTLRDIAEATGGFYVPLGASGYGLEQVFESGLKSIPDQDLGSRRTKIGIERFQWPLGLALFLLAWEPLVGTRKLFMSRRLRKLSQGKQNAAAALIALLGAACLLAPADAHAQQSAPAPSAPTPLAAPAPGAATPSAAPDGSATEAPETTVASPAVNLSPAQAAKLYRSGNYAAAAQAYAAAAAANPTDSEASYNLGNSLYAQGEYEAARQAYQQALTALDLELQADAFYNLGNASYQLGKAALADTPPAADIRQANEAAFAQTKEALDTGNDILKRAEPNRTPAALRNEEATQTLVPQQEIQQAIQQAEQAKQATTQAQEQSESAASAGENSSTFWREATDEYKSSLELAPDKRDAANNLGVVTRKLDRQAENNEAFSKEAKQLAENAEVLDMLIEELKKLLEQQQNDQNQQDNQQNQDQQNQDQNPQNDQQQSQDQQQQNDQNQQQQNQQNNQQSSSDSSQQQNQEQSQQNSGQQDQQNSQNQNQDQQSGQQDQQQSSEQQQQDKSAGQQQDQQSGEQEQPDQQDSQKQDENSAGEDQSGQDQPKPEEQQDKGEQPGEEDSQNQQQPQQPQPGQSGQQQQPAGAEPQQDQGGPGEEGLSQEQLQELSEQVAQEQQAAAEAGQEGEKKPVAAVGEGGEETKDVPRVPGVMTREEARRLLDALKKDDKKLPSLYVPQQYNVDDEGKRKDW
jgi:Ca-activated chloride channel family protein